MGHDFTPANHASKSSYRRAETQTVVLKKQAGNTLVA